MRSQRRRLFRAFDASSIDEVASIYRSIALSDAKSFSEPFAAERWASSAVGSIRASCRSGEDFEAIGDRLVEELERVPQQAAFLALRGLEAMRTWPSSDLAAIAAERMRDRVVRSPRWEPAIGTARLARMRSIGNEIEEQGEVVTLELERLDCPPERFILFVDHQRGGLIKHVVPAGARQELDHFVAMIGEGYEGERPQEVREVAVERFGELVARAIKAKYGHYVGQIKPFLVMEYWFAALAERVAPGSIVDAE